MMYCEASGHSSRSVTVRIGTTHPDCNLDDILEGVYDNPYLDLYTRDLGGSVHYRATILGDLDDQLEALGYEVVSYTDSRSTSGEFNPVKASDTLTVRIAGSRFVLHVKVRVKTRRDVPEDVLRLQIGRVMVPAVVSTAMDGILRARLP